jgi:predicted site-specific integrase-resolvase
VVKVKVEVEIEIEDYSSVPDAAAALSVAEITVWRWIKDHKIPSVKFEGRTIIPNYAIEELQKRESSPEGALAAKGVKR